MVLVEVDHLRPDLWPIPQRLIDTCRKLGPVHLLAAWTALDLGTMPGDFHPYRREVKHLPPFIVTHGHVFQRGLASLAALHPVHLDVIRVFHGPEGVPWMPGWAPTFLPLDGRRLRGAGFFGSSPEGSLLLLRLFLASRSSNA